MKFMCLAYEAEETFTSMSPQEWSAVRDETLAYVDDLRKSGRLVMTNALQGARTASMVRVRENEVIISDGPFAETKEQIGGFFLIEAKDKAEAIEIASKWPGARFGNIEVRPVEEALRVEGRY
jgi:hypothetical protein